ncbi:hypothetical protein M8C13_06155 [Crossiella sp. SN42]|uniref:hypothetical protein n=1 Tax=Crossiella sp. SN42 TaxID=2944808 RepID=UPI00207D6968|nr:hypothetical protein [Crossiella sp. SN42]MCO1575342.1 hypothetical protein [Crossiella sp. SN42]
MILTIANDLHTVLGTSECHGRFQARQRGHIFTFTLQCQDAHLAKSHAELLYWQVSSYNSLRHFPVGTRHFCFYVVVDSLDQSGEILHRYHGATPGGGIPNYTEGPAT